MQLLDRLLQIKNSTIFKNSVLVSSVQVVVVVIGFLANAFLARILGPEHFGNYQLLLSLLAIGAIMGLSGFGVSILRAGLKGYDYFFWRALRYSVMAAFAGAVIIGAVAWVLFNSSLITQRTSILIGLVAFGILTAGLQHYDSALNGNRDYKSSRLLALFGALINLILVSAVAYSTRSAEWVFISYLITRLIVSLIGLLLLKKKRVSGERNQSFERELLIQGTRQTAVNIFTISASRLDKIVLGAIDPMILGFYYVGTFIPAQLMANSKTILGVITAEWGAESSESNRKKLKHHSLILFLFGLIACILLILTLPRIIPLVYGESYIPAIAPGQYYSLILIGSFWFSMYNAHNQFQADGKSTQNLEIFKHILFVALLYLTIKEYGLMGILFSQISSHFVMYAIAFLKFKRSDII